MIHGKTYRRFDPHPVDPQRDARPQCLSLGASAICGRRPELGSSSADRSASTRRAAPDQAPPFARRHWASRLHTERRCQALPWCFLTDSGIRPSWCRTESRPAHGNSRTFWPSKIRRESAHYGRGSVCRERLIGQRVACRRANMPAWGPLGRICCVRRSTSIPR
jgi:hypothetical protein